jgi:hypothetical protein
VTETLAGSAHSDIPWLRRRRTTKPRPYSGSKMSPFIMYPGEGPVFSVEISKSGLSSNDPTIPHPAKDHLLAVYYRGDDCIRLRFADGVVKEMSLADIGLDVSRLRLSTVRMASWGGAAEIEDQNHHTIHIDSSVLRAHVDPQYAAILKEAITELQ